MKKEISQLQEKLDVGYEYYLNRKTDMCRVTWFEAWELVKNIFDHDKITKIDQFDKKYKLAYPVFNWASDMQDLLMNSGKYEECISFCQWLSPLYDKNEINKVNAQIAIGESYFQLDRREEGEAQFEKITSEYPQNVWGWINWADQYWLLSIEEDFERGEKILLKGLEVKGIDEKRDFYERLLDLYNKWGKKDKADEIHNLLKKNIASNNSRVKNVNESEFSHTNQTSMTTEKIKIGRNDPCPCGSGKKYKKCCL